MKDLFFVKLGPWGKGRYPPAEMDKMVSLGEHHHKVILKT